MQPIFISSTFRDMQAERDVMNIDVLPEIRQFARQLGEAVDFIDLRWGIDTSELDKEETQRQVLSVCLDAIEDSRPYLVAFLGQRYGMVPEEVLLKREIEGRKDEWTDLDLLDKSITALEIEYGAFSKKGQPERCLFYFRDPIDESLLTPEQKRDYLAESKEDTEKLERLKARIRKLAKGSVRRYHYGWDA